MSRWNYAGRQWTEGFCITEKGDRVLVWDETLGTWECVVCSSHNVVENTEQDTYKDPAIAVDKAINFHEAWQQMGYVKGVAYFEQCPILDDEDLVEVVEQQADEMAAPLDARASFVNGWRAGYKRTRERKAT